jgi:Predicted transcriptional regulators
MGQIIKRLRKERNFTQDELAEQLNISTAAISKWENDTSMPDIAQVVPLATVFGVSTDVLFGTFGTNDNEEVEKLIVETQEPISIAYSDKKRLNAYEERYEKYLDSLKKYPNNIMLLRNALDCGVCLIHYYIQNNDQLNTQKVLSESERESRLIITYCNNISLICDTYEYLFQLYTETKQYDKAKESVNNLPFSVSATKLAEIFDSEGNTEAAINTRCSYFDAVLRDLDRQILFLGNDYIKKEQYRDAIKVYLSMFDIKNAIYGVTEYTPPLMINTYYHAQLAICFLKLGDIENALTWLEKMYQHYMCIEANYNKTVKLDTPVLREVDYHFFKKEYHAKDTIKTFLLWESFDPIRDNPRFIALLGKVDALPE